MGTDNCVFHNLTRGSISVNGYDEQPLFATLNCFYYGIAGAPDGMHTLRYGLTTSDANPTGYGVDNKADGAQPGWSFAAGLGSVNATNLLIAWRAFVHAPAAPAPPSSPSQPTQAVSLY